jgi:hypothetical protein
MRRLLLAGAACVTMSGSAMASDHLDSPAVVADPRADIGDLYAWTSSDAKRLNLVMTLVGKSFSDRLTYTFQVDSGPHFGATTERVTITCRIAAEVECRAGDVKVTGDASDPAGLTSGDGRLRVFAGRRDDPFFNNVRGSRDAFNFAAATLTAGATRDAAGCPRFEPIVAYEILDRWRYTEGGMPKNLLVGWTPMSLVVSVDLSVVAKGGRMLAVWGATASPERQIDRAGRPLTGNALLASLGPAEVSDAMKDDYNRSTPADGPRFAPEIARGLALYDGYDGQCGDGWLIDGAAPPAARYAPLANLLADDRLWVNAASGDCRELFAVERAALGGEPALAGDCGGRTPNYSAANVYRSLLAGGKTTGVSDGLERDEREHSTDMFPFLATAEGSGR